MDRAGYPPDGARNDQRMDTKIDEKRFVKDALLGGMTEVELGKVALEKASADAVKQFAQKMIDNHSKANEELKQLAAKEKIDVPDALDSKRQSRIEKLSKLSGADFDRAYIKDQLKDYQNDVREFQAESQNGNDPEVKGFASKTLPVLEEHLRMVKELDKGKKATASR
jgi:putative membrane protein